MDLNTALASYGPGGLLVVAALLLLRDWLAKRAAASSPASPTPGRLIPPQGGSGTAPAGGPASLIASLLARLPVAPPAPKPVSEMEDRQAVRITLDSMKADAVAGDELRRWIAENAPAPATKPKE